jgi:hypothetical protein
MSKPRWKNPDKRMARAAELRAQGWSLRRIAEELAVGVATIHRDLSRYASTQQRPEEIAESARPSLRIIGSDVPSSFQRNVPSKPNGTPQWNADGTVRGA